MSFDRVADLYWLLERVTFGRTLQKARTFGIDKIPEQSNALIVGEGDGRFLEVLVRMHRNVEVECVEASARMLELARRRLVRRQPAALNRVRFHQSGVCAATLGHYDLIVTNFFLDCFEGNELESVVAKIAGAASPNCVWLMADFTVPNGGWRELHARAWIGLMYWFFRLTTGIHATELNDPSPLLRKAGFKLRQQKRWWTGMVKSEVWERGRAEG